MSAADRERRYQIARAAGAELEAACAAAAEPLKAAPRGAMGLTPDSAKTPAWRAAYAEHAAAFRRLRNFNRIFCKMFAAEIRRDRDAKRAALQRIST